jgi:hypothetical protein
MANTTLTGRARYLPLTAVLLVAAVLRSWRLHQNGYDNEGKEGEPLELTSR